MEPIRLHMLAIPHTITNNEYSHCAFTGKVLRFCPMMLSRGFEVYHYGVESSTVIASKRIDVITKTEWNELKYKSYKNLHPELSDEAIAEKLSNPKHFVGDLANYNTPLYSTFNEKLREELKKNYRSTSTDIVCLPFGYAHDSAIANLNIVAIETGIGYNGSYKPYRIFESNAWKHFALGENKLKCSSNYWFVIPNYYDVLEWSFIEKPSKKKIGFLGRICQIKGLDVFVEIAKRFPHIEFIICGQGDETPYVSKSNNIVYQPPIHGSDRSKYLSELTAIVTPSIFVEPFCGVNVEAQLCGVPVIANDFGAFTETIEPFKTGLLCHTLADFCYGVQMALDDKFDRKYIRQRATEKYDMYNVAKQYDYVFKTILDIYNGKNGWYSPDSYIDMTLTI